MKTHPKKIILFILIAIGLLSLSLIWTKKEDGANWREYTRKAYFDECTKQIDKDHGKRAIDAVRLSDELKDCKIVATERW